MISTLCRCKPGDNNAGIYVEEMNPINPIPKVLRNGVSFEDLQSPNFDKLDKLDKSVDLLKYNEEDKDLNGEDAKSQFKDDIKSSNHHNISCININNEDNFVQDESFKAFGIGRKKSISVNEDSKIAMSLIKKPSFVLTDENKNSIKNKNSADSTMDTIKNTSVPPHSDYFSFQNEEEVLSKIAST